MTRHGNFKHGMKFTPEYRVWEKIRQRCRDKSDMLYAGRGITLCSRWNNFLNFYKDMGPRPESKPGYKRSYYSIERIDNNSGYSPKNCKWATPLEQGKNKRNNVWITYKGIRYHLMEASRVFGIKERTLAQRINNGWPHNEVIERPVIKGNNQSLRRVLWNG